MSQETLVAAQQYCNSLISYKKTNSASSQSKIMGVLPWECNRILWDSQRPHISCRTKWGKICVISVQITDSPVCINSKRTKLQQIILFKRLLLIVKSTKTWTHRSVNFVKKAMPDGIGPLRPLACITLPSQEISCTIINKTWWKRSCKEN